MACLTHTLGVRSAGVVRVPQVIATSRSPYHKEAQEMGVGYFTDVNDFCEEHPDVVILATSILSLETVGGRQGAGSITGTPLAFRPAVPASRKRVWTTV